MNKTKAVWNMARDYAREKRIPVRKALNWFPPYDLDQRREFIQSLPEYDVIELEAGGIIAIESGPGGIHDD